MTIVTPKRRPETGPFDGERIAPRTAFRSCFRKAPFVLCVLAGMLTALAAPSAAGAAATTNLPVFHRIGTLRNFRDIGGWRGLDGRTVRFGQIYRSDKFNVDAKEKATVDAKGVTNRVNTAARILVTEADRAVITGKLGVRTDIDLRNHRECRGMRGSPLGKDVAWVHLPITPGSYPNPKTGAAAPETRQLKKIFAVMMDRAKRPLVFHCSIGRDRTGKVAMLTLALLGVSEDDIVRDYVASPYCVKKEDWAKGMRKTIGRLKANFPADSLAETAAKCFECMGFVRADIERFRTDMLNDERNGVKCTR